MEATAAPYLSAHLRRRPSESFPASIYSEALARRVIDGVFVRSNLRRPHVAAATLAATAIAASVGLVQQRLRAAVKFGGRELDSNWEQKPGRSMDQRGRKLKLPERRAAYAANTHRGNFPASPRQVMILHRY